MPLFQPKSRSAEELAALAANELVDLARAGDPAAIRYIIQVHNRRL